MLATVASDSHCNQHHLKHWCIRAPTFLCISTIRLAAGGPRIAIPAALPCPVRLPHLCHQLHRQQGMPAGCKEVFAGGHLRQPQQLRPNGRQRLLGGALRQKCRRKRCKWGRNMARRALASKSPQPTQKSSKRTRVDDHDTHLLGPRSPFLRSEVLPFCRLAAPLGGQRPRRCSRQRRRRPASAPAARGGLSFR
jgi:hypothetical protein